MGTDVLLEHDLRASVESGSCWKMKNGRVFIAFSAAKPFRKVASYVPAVIVEYLRYPDLSCARTLTTTPGLASAEVAAAPFWYTNFVFEFSSNLWARARPSRSVSVEPSLPVTQPAAPKCL